MDTYFYTPTGIYNFEDRAEITKAVGFDATYLSLWDGRMWEQVLPLHEVKERYGLDVAAVYIVVDLSQGDDSPSLKGVFQALRNVPEGTTIELAMQTVARGMSPSDPAGDVAAIIFLRKALEIAHERNLDLLFYSHYSHWTHSHLDAIRLCEKVDDPRLGMVFVGYHWFITQARQLADTMRQAQPFIRQASLAGARRSQLGWAKQATIEPLDVGELDNFAILAQLRRTGFNGYIGAQGWDEGGDVYAKLVRSLAALKSMDERAAAHPHWASHINESARAG